MVILPSPRTLVLYLHDRHTRLARAQHEVPVDSPMIASFATITSRMRLNFFSQSRSSDVGEQTQEDVRPEAGRTFPADEVAWGITIRNGFDELDDPWYHRGVTQHAYLEGNDNVAICGFKPPQSGPRTRRRSRLGMPTTGEHPMCGICARMVVAPRPRVSVPIQPDRPTVAVPVARPVPQPVAAGVIPLAVGEALDPRTLAVSAPSTAPAPLPAQPMAPPPARIERPAPTVGDRPAAIPLPESAPPPPWVRRLHRDGRDQT